MPKKPSISQEELDTFHQAVAGTKPLTKKKIRLTPPSPLKQPIRHEPEMITLNESQDLASVSGDEYIAYKQTDVSNKTLSQLRQGYYPVEALLDLHGMSIDKAKTAVATFLHTCLQEKRHVVLIIHGKGHHSPYPILKNKLNHWLRNIEAVLAFCSAVSSHGSRGAIYVMLKVNKREPSHE